MMLRVLRIVHKTTGLIGALIVLIMAITGFLLNNRSFIGYRTESAVQLQKFIFSLHTGSIADNWIVWITDIGAICIMILCITGPFMWAIIKIKKSKNNRRRITNEK